jgi:dTDP-4-amino-4,6-dideoxygalactose transaminase
MEHGSLIAEVPTPSQPVVRDASFVQDEAVDRFEEEFAWYCGVAHCVGVSSGTAALSLILRANGIGPGDEVIVPDHGFVASALAVRDAGALPVLCDVDQGSGLIDPDAARALVSRRTAAIVAVHLYGQACDVPAIEAFARQAGLLVLEDASHAPGARLRGRPVGALGTAGAFSFAPGKNLGAHADAGAVCTDDDWLAERVRSLRNRRRAATGNRTGTGSGERLDARQAALLRVKLPYLDAWNAARRQHAIRYRELLPDDLRLLTEGPDSPCVYHVFPVRVSHRDAVAASLALSGIETAIHYEHAVHQQPLWNGDPPRRGRVVRAEIWAQEELSLPMHPDLDPREVERVAKAMRRMSDLGLLTAG